MTAYQFSQPWLSKINGDQEATAMEFAHLRDYLKGIDEGSIPLFNPHFLHSTIDGLLIGGNIAMGGFKLTGLGAGTTAGDSLRYEQLIGLYLLLTGGTMSGAIAMGSNKVTGLTNASASGDALSWGQAFTSGQITFSPTTTGIKGTTTNDDAAAGNVGEYISSYAGGAGTNFPTSSQWGDLTSISLTAGDWSVDCNIDVLANGATATNESFGISTTSGNSATGLNSGDNQSSTPLATVTFDGSGVIPAFRMSLSATTTVYFKYLAVYSAGTPKARGRISARRIR